MSRRSARRILVVEQFGGLGIAFLDQSADDGDRIDMNTARGEFMGSLIDALLALTHWQFAHPLCHFYK
jgi:hypothetical protein